HYSPCRDQHVPQLERRCEETLFRSQCRRHPDLECPPGRRHSPSTHRPPGVAARRSTLTGRTTMSEQASNPEIGQSIQTGAILTNYHDIGSGEPVLLLHGSWPGVSSWAIWRLPIQGLKYQLRLLSPDLAGYGYTQVPLCIEYSRQ